MILSLSATFLWGRHGGRGFCKQTAAFPRSPSEQDTNLDVATLWHPPKHEPEATPLRAAVYSSELLSF